MRPQIEKLRTDVALAEANGFPYGVSVLLFNSAPLGSRSSPIPIATAAFEIQKTGNRPNHYTVVFPKPLNQSTVNLFNTIFIPR